MKYEKTLSKIFFTSDTKLATFLTTTGHTPRDKTPLVRKETKKGIKCEWYFDQFERLNEFGRKLETSLGIWKQGMKWVIQNPKDGEAKVLQAIKTYDFLCSNLDIDKGNTMVFYKVDGNTFATAKGSKKAILMEEKGYEKI